MDRRNFLRGLVAAPAIVAFHNIMPVKSALWVPQYIVAPAGPRFLFVAPDGSDLNDGLSLGNPIRTLQRAIELIGDLNGETLTIQMAEGHYAPPSSPFNVSDGGSMILQGAGDKTVLEAGLYLDVKNQSVAFLNDMTIELGA